MATDKAKKLGSLLLHAKQGSNGNSSNDDGQVEGTKQQRGKKADDKTTGASSSDFWGQFEKEGTEATDRLNVEVKRSLHERFKRRCSKLGVTKREAVEALLEWCLDDN